MSVLISEVRKFFSEFEDFLLLFANNHNLAIRKFEKGSPDWTLIGKHPRDGIFSIIIYVPSIETRVLQFGVAWTSHDYISMIQRSSYVPVSEFKCELEKITPTLERCFKVAWLERPQDWQSVSDMSGSWRNFSLEERIKLFGFSSLPETTP